MQIYDRFTGEEFKRHYTRFMQLEDDPRPEDVTGDELITVDIIGTFFEGIGVLVKRGLIDMYLVDDIMSGHIIRTLEKIRDPVLEMRKNQDRPQMLEWHEYLYEKIKSIVEEQHPELKP